MVAGAAAILVGGALMWQMYGEGGDEAEELDEDELMEVLVKAKVDKVKYDGNLLDTGYFLQLLQCIGESVKE